MEKSFVGHEIVLNPRMSGMYLDPVNRFTLSFFDKGNDRINVTEKMNTTFIARNVTAGILFVFKDGKDVTQKFGGPPNEDWSQKPIVKAPARVSSKDERYLKVINRLKQEEIVRDIKSIKDVPTLERLMELEMKGNNPSAQSRAGVIDAIKAQMKTIPGVGKAKELEEEKEKITVT